MIWPKLSRIVRTSLLMFLTISFQPMALAQGARKPLPETPIKDADADHEELRSKWFLHGRVVPGKSSAELRHHAYQSKMEARTARMARMNAALPATVLLPASGGWTPRSGSTGFRCHGHGFSGLSPGFRAGNRGGD